MQIEFYVQIASSGVGSGHDVSPLAQVFRSHGHRLLCLDQSIISISCVSSYKILQMPFNHFSFPSVWFLCSCRTPLSLTASYVLTPWQCPDFLLSKALSSNSPFCPLINKIERKGKRVKQETLSHCSVIFLKSMASCADGMGKEMDPSTPEHSLTASLLSRGNLT